MIQSVVLDKAQFSKEEAIRWIKEHDYKPNTSAANFDTTSFWRFRQMAPSSQYRYRTKVLTPGIEIVLAYAKTSRRKRKMRGTRKR